MVCRWQGPNPSLSLLQGTGRSRTEEAGAASPLGRQVQGLLLAPQRLQGLRIHVEPMTAERWLAKASRNPH